MRARPSNDDDADAEAADEDDTEAADDEEGADPQAADDCYPRTTTTAARRGWRLGRMREDAPPQRPLPSLLLPPSPPTAPRGTIDGEGRGVGDREGGGCGVEEKALLI